MRLTAAGKLSCEVDQRVVRSTSCSASLTTQLFFDPTDDRPAVLTGRVNLRLTSARSNVKLGVRLSSRATVLDVNRTLLDVTLDLGEGRSFVAGDNSIDFSFSVPTQTAPTEGCPYGTIEHYVSAYALGLGTLGSDLRVEQEIDCHANPGGQGPPPGLEAQIDAFAPALGPVAISAFAEKLTVATMALIDVRLPDPPLAQTIEAVISIEQTMRVTPFEGPQEEQTMPPLVHELRRTRLPLEIGKVGRLRELVRLPRATPKDAGFGSWEQWSPIHADPYIPPCPSDHTTMSLIAQLVVDLQYQDADGVDRILSCGKEVVLAHCTFLTSSCQLPVYSENDLLDPSAIARHGLKLGSASGPLFCLCQITDESMIRVEGMTLLQAHGDVLPQPAEPLARELSEPAQLIGSIVLAHCSFSTASVQLPRYSEIDTGETIYEPASGPAVRLGSFACRCRVPTERMIGLDGRLLLEAHPEETAQSDPEPPRKNVVDEP